MLEKLICEYCGNEFLCEYRTKKRRFCSKNCASMAQKHKKNNESEKVMKQCLVCGKVEYVAKSRAKTYKTCSIECSKIYRKNKPKKQITKKCPICGKEFSFKSSSESHHKTCGSQECKSKWYSITRSGSLNSNYKSLQKALQLSSTCQIEKHSQSRPIYMQLVKCVLGLKNVRSIPKGYVVHHKDANHLNNELENLILIPIQAHRQIHTIFGNVLINALHTGKLDREIFFSICNDDQRKFYENIIDLDITKQSIVMINKNDIDYSINDNENNIYKFIYVNEKDITTLK